jgi:hypothetical protein
MLGVSRAHFGQGQLPLTAMVPAIFQGLCVIVLPFLLMWGFDRRLVGFILIGGLASLLAGLAFLHLQPALDNCPATPTRWVRQALIAAGLSLLAWLSISVHDMGVLAE